MPRGRPADPDTPYRMFAHKNGKYTYVATCRPKGADGSARSNHSLCHWGRLDDDRVFRPNNNYLLLSPAERDRFIFPPEWDISGVRQLPSHRGPGRTAYVAADQDRLYGHIWLLEKLADSLGVLSDLERVFERNREKAQDVLSLAIYSIVSDKAFSRMSDIQEVMCFPTSRKLTPCVITRITQSITEQNRMDLFRLRQSRAGKGNLCAVDSTTRPGYGHMLADMAWGHSKDHLSLAQTSEVVVYSLTRHEPLYYRTFAGNMPDCRGLRTILGELDHSGLQSSILVTDRGYAVDSNLKLCIQKKQRLLSAVQVEQRRFRSSIQAVLAESGDPSDHMEWISKIGCYARQFDLKASVTGRHGAVIEADRLKLTLCYSLEKRKNEVALFEDEIHRQQTILENMKEKQMALPSSDLRRFPCFSVVRNKETKVVESFERKEAVYRWKKQLCGFFGFVTLGLDYDARQTVTTYRLRDEQEKYFHSMKDKIHAERQRCWTEASMHGRRFIEFVALILVSRLNDTWSNSEVLRSAFKTVDSILTEMSRIHCVEHQHREKIITPFVGRQLTICEVFGYPVPNGCQPIYIKSQTRKK